MELQFGEQARITALEIQTKLEEAEKQIELTDQRFSSEDVQNILREAVNHV
ncbi:MAG: hypothetical protein R3Y53_06245 [Bacillota bacterium]